MKRTLVCFDIGGVLVRIRHTWDEALAAAGATPRWSEPRPHAHDPLLGAYQDGTLDEAEYLSQLAHSLGVDRDQARATHDAILDADYPSALKLVRSLRAAGVATACLSNTNHLHWGQLASLEHHPAVASLDRRYASFEIGANKPEAAAFRAIENDYPDWRVVYFDDLSPNVAAAKRFGWDAQEVDPAGDPPARIAETLRALGILSPDALERRAA